MRLPWLCIKEYMSDKTTEVRLTAQYKDTIIEDAYWQIFINDSARLTLCRNALLVRRKRISFLYYISWLMRRRLYFDILLIVVRFMPVLGP